MRPPPACKRTAGNEITIPVADADGDNTIDDFTITTPDDLDKYKNAKRHTVQSIFSFNAASMGGLTLFRAMVSFSVLAAAGHFINADNREEKYLEIINTGDTDLISALEEYLDAYDAITPILSMWNDVKQFETDLEAATTEEEVDAAAHMFDTAS